MAAAGSASTLAVAIEVSATAIRTIDPRTIDPHTIIRIGDHTITTTVTTITIPAGTSAMVITTITSAVTGVTIEVVTDITSIFAIQVALAGATMSV